MLADTQILQPTFVFYRPVTKLFQDGATKETGCFTDDWPFFGAGIKLHICEAAGWRSVFENKAVHFFQTVKKPSTKLAHFVRNVQAGGRLDHFETVSRGNDPHGRTRSPQANLDFGTNTDEFHMRLKACDEFVLYDFSVVSAGIKANTFADNNSWFREHGQASSSIARTIPLSIPAKTNWCIGYKRYQ